MRVAQIAALLVLAPVCAEYLAAYDDSTGRPAELLAGLVVFVPLYGCSALLIREVARRAGLGWPGILLLGSAFGLIQAGLVDQSLFSSDYRGIEGWAEGYRGTLIAPLGISAVNLLSFVGGHAVFSIAAPIALVEAAVPAHADRPWLGRRGLVLTAALYLAASALVLEEHLRTEVSHASAGQVVGSVVVVALLVTAAVRGRGRSRHPVSDRPAPSVPLVLAAALVVAAVNESVGETWTGVALSVASYAVAGVGVAVLSGRPGWSERHIVVVAAAPLICRGVLAFTYPPLIGEVSQAAKYGHNAAMLAVVLGVATVAFRASRPHRDTDGVLTQGAGRTAG